MPAIRRKSQVTVADPQPPPRRRSTSRTQHQDSAGPADRRPSRAGRTSDTQRGASPPATSSANRGSTTATLSGPPHGLTASALAVSAAFSPFEASPSGRPRRMEATIGERMARLRIAKGLSTHAVAAATHLGTAAQYEGVEAGSSPLEYWAAVCGRFAVGLRLPVERLFPDLVVVEPPPPVASHSASAPASASTIVPVDALATQPAEGVAPPAVFQPPVATGRHATSCGAHLRRMRMEAGLLPEAAFGRTPVGPAAYGAIESGLSAGGYEKWVSVLARFCRLVQAPAFTLVCGLPIQQEEEPDSDDGTASEVESDGSLFEAFKTPPVEESIAVA